MLPSGSLIGRNPYETFPQIRLICEALGIELGSEPTEDEIQMLFDTLGKGKVYGANAEEIAIGNEIYDNLNVMIAISEMLIGFGPRSVYGDGGPGLPVNVPAGMFVAEQDYEPLIELRFAGTANWNVRRAEESKYRRQLGLKIDRVVLLAGTRPHNDKAGSNPYVERFVSAVGSLPVEFQLLAIIGEDIVGQRHDDVVCVSNELDDNAREFAKIYQDELEAGKGVYVATNSAADDKPIQIRARIREIVPGFDSDPENPQLYFSSDGFQVATSPEEAAKPVLYQRPTTFLSAIPRYVRQFHELTA